MKLRLGLFVAAGLVGAPLVARAEPMVALKVSGTSNALVTFDSAMPGTVSADKAVTGLDAGDLLASIEWDIARARLVGVSQQGKLYTLTIDVNGSVAAKVGVNAPAITLTGTSLDLDYDPTLFRMRLVSNTGENLRLDAQTLTVSNTDTALSYAVGTNCAVRDLVNTPQVVGVAYRNNVGSGLAFTDATGTNNGQLQYGLDARTSRLVRIGGTSPHDGCVLDVGALGVTTAANSIAGFDISPVTSTAFASLTVGASTGLYTVNLATGAAALVGAFASADIRDVVAIGGPKSAPIFGLTRTNDLFLFDAAKPGAFTVPPAKITGLAGGAGETIEGIDVRPATGELYGLGVAGGTGRLYKIDKATAVATVVNATGFPVSGTIFGVDFDPLADVLRIVSDSGKNYRVHPSTSVLTTDTELDAGGPPHVTAIAYTDNATLFALDPGSRTLYRQGPPGDGPNGGQLFTIAPLGLETSATGNTALLGFDIGPSGTAYAVGNGGQVARLYEVSLETSSTPAARFGTFLGDGDIMVDIAVDYPLVIVAPDAGAADASADASSSSSSSSSSGGASSSSTSSGSPPVVIDPGTKVPGSSGQTETVGEEDDGCRTSPSGPLAPSALVLALASLWFVRRKKR